MRNLWQYLFLIVCGSGLLGQTVKAADEVDNGTTDDGVVVWAPTLAKRCELSSQQTEEDGLGDCFDRLASDYKLNETPSGETYREEVEKILHEQIGSYLPKALGRLIENGENHKKIMNEAGKGGGLEAKPNPPTDIRDSIEQTVKVNQMNAETNITLIDNISLRQLANRYGNVYFFVIPELAQSMTEEDAQAKELRRDRIHQ